MFINEDEIYTYDPLRRPHWEIDAMKYGDWTASGTYTKFIEFPLSKVCMNEKKRIFQIVYDL
jgi:hypothetical protein